MGLPVDTLPLHFYTLVCCLSDKLRGQLAFTPTSPLRQAPFESLRVLDRAGSPIEGEGNIGGSG